MSPPADDDFPFDDLDALDTLELDQEEKALTQVADKRNSGWNAHGKPVGSMTFSNNGPRPTTQPKAPAPSQDEFDDLGDLGNLDDHELFSQETPSAPVRPPASFSVNPPRQGPPQPNPWRPQIQQQPQRQQQQQQQQQQQPAQPTKMFSIFSSAKNVSSTTTSTNSNPTSNTSFTTNANSTNNNSTTLQRTTSAATFRNSPHNSLARNHSSPAINNAQNNRFQKQGSHNTISSYFATNTSARPSGSGGIPQQASLFTTHSAPNILPRSDPKNHFTTDISQSPENVPGNPQRPTHHFTDKQAALTWQYPINYPKRDYQYNIIRRALFTNTLVSLPTGLGKTFIAAVVMLNYYRWFPKSKIIFMAPTRPLVNQQIEACFNICGIPQEDTVELTGLQNAELRRNEWHRKRVIYCTPQVLQNDLRSGFCSGEEIVCLVVDEAHRATGRYAYSEVIRLLEPINQDVRVMALTATPGSDIKTVQQVVQNLKIAKIELRTEDSMDLQQYIFKRTVQEMIVPCGREIGEIRDKFQRMMRPFLERLAKLNIIRTTDPGQLTRFAILQGKDIFLRENGQSGNKAFVMKQIAVCMGLVHAYELLTVHGIRPFFANMDPFSSNRSTDGASTSGPGGSKQHQVAMDMDDDDNKPSLARKAMEDIPDFMKMMDSIRIKMKQPNFVSHPKMERLVGVVVQHFMDLQDENDNIVQARAESAISSGVAADEDPPLQTRVMIFANYRESVEEITRVLNQHRPLIKVQSFIGQATAKGKKGISQKEQQKVVANFQKGEHNVLVATSIGEEGLDIGDVDLIICYDSHASPIRMLQRMGRTGRKRKGKICLLLAEGHEEQKYRRAQSSYKTVQRAIANGTNIHFFTHSPRILPPGPPPTCDLVHINVPKFVALSAGRKRKREADVGAGSGSKANRNAFLDPQEFARFQQKYRLPMRDLRTITFQQACLKMLGNKKSSVTPNTTFRVGHSTRTMDYIGIANQISRSRLEQSLYGMHGSSEEKDPYSKRMSDLIDRWGPTGLGIYEASSDDVVSKSRATEQSRRAKNGDQGALKRNPGTDQHEALSDDEIEQLNAWQSNRSNHVPARKRHFILDDDSDGDNDNDNNFDEDSAPKSLVSNRTDQLSSGPMRTGISKGNKISTASASLFRSTAAQSRSVTAASTSTRPIPSYLSTISDDEVDKEIMDGFGLSFEHHHHDDEWAPDMFPEKRTSTSIRNAFDTESIRTVGSHSTERLKGFDFQELSTPPMWYKPDGPSGKHDSAQSTDVDDPIGYDESFTVFELPPVPEPGKWYQPILPIPPHRDLPYQGSGMARDAAIGSKVRTVPAKEEVEEEILFIEDSDDELGVDKGKTCAPSYASNMRDTFAYQQGTLSTARTSSFTSDSLKRNAGFVSARSLAASMGSGMDKGIGRSDPQSKGHRQAPSRGRGDTNPQLWGDDKDVNDRRLNKAREGSSEIDDFEDLMLRDEDLQDDFLWE